MIIAAIAIIGLAAINVTPMVLKPKQLSEYDIVDCPNIKI